MLDFRYIDPYQLKAAWPLIKEGVQKIAELQDIFTPEDVYAEIKNTTAVLHILYIDNKYEGFLVTQQLTHHDGPVLHVWCAYSKLNRDAHILEQGLPTLEKWARNINAKRITFSSVRKGWIKNKLNFKPLFTTYGLELGE